MRQSRINFKQGTTNFIAFKRVCRICTKLPKRPIKRLKTVSTTTALPAT